VTNDDIYHELQAAGVPLDSHESDLYAKVTPASRAIVNRWRHARTVTIFTSQIDGARWFDIPFAYLPFWERVQRYGGTP
jgi:hypothetical protein